MKKTLMLISTMLLLFILPAAAQQGPPVTDAPSQMALFDRITGHWEGTGWYRSASGRTEFRQTEDVRKAIHGHAIVVEGRGVDAESSEIVHDALAVIRWDPKEERFVLHAFKADGSYVAASGKAEGDLFIWGFDTGRGTVRYTMDLSKEGKWTESGEFSADGETWMKFIEMNLARTSD